MWGNNSRANLPPTVESLSVAKDTGSLKANAELQLKFWTQSEESEAAQTLDSIASMASLEPGLKLYKKGPVTHVEGSGDHFQLEGPKKSVINFYDQLLKKLSLQQFQRETIEETEDHTVVKLYKPRSDSYGRPIPAPLVYMSVGSIGGFRRLTSIEQQPETRKCQTFNKIVDTKRDYESNEQKHAQCRSLNFLSQPCIQASRREIISKGLNHSTTNIRFNCLRIGVRRDHGDSNNRKYQTAAKTEANIVPSASSLQILPKTKPCPTSLDGMVHYSVNKTQPSSQYLFVSGFDFREFSIVNICNLFGNYGNIEAACYSQDLGECLLTFSNVQGARYAKENLGEISLQGYDIKVNYTDSCHESLTVSDRLPLKYTPLKRFSTKGSGLPNQANPVSRTLHLTYSSDSDSILLDDSVLLAWLSQSGEVVRLKRELFKKKKNMWFAEFRSETDAIRVLMREHGKLFQGGILRVSFTKTI